MSTLGNALALAEDEVVTLASELIRIDTTNTGDPATLVGEREAAEYVAEKLDRGRLRDDVRRVGRARAGGNVIARLAGARTRRGARCSCTATSTWCPPTPSEWSVHPFSGAVQDGYVWGRGAVDMKDMVGMTLALARHFKRNGIVPPRDMCSRSSPTRRPAAVRREVAGGAPPGAVRGRHRGDQRGRRVLDHAEGRRARLPHRDRREGHPLAASCGSAAPPATAR